MHTNILDLKHKGNQHNNHLIQSADDKSNQSKIYRSIKGNSQTKFTANFIRMYQNTIVKIFVEAVLDKWRQLMSVMSQSGGRN